MSANQASQKSSNRQGPAGMKSFIFMALALHVPLFVYPVIRLCGWLELNVLITSLILVPVVLSQILSRWLLRDARAFLARSVRHVADLLLGISPIVLLTLLVFEVPVAFSLLEPRTAALSLLALVSVVTALGVSFALLPAVKTVSFASPQLKRALRFVQITDVHIGSRSSRFLAGVVRKVNAVSPEFLCITGDFIDARGITLDDLASLRLLKCPVYFTSGNHERYEDFEEILERLRSLDVEVLQTRSICPREDVQILGIDDHDHPGQVERELKKLTAEQNAFTILMYHRPNGLEAAERAGVDLMISGHTHNGQIFPFNLIVNRVFDRIVGLYEFGSARLYVSQGTGTWGPVLRVGTRCEITLFELEAG